MSIEAERLKLGLSLTVLGNPLVLIFVLWKLDGFAQIATAKCLEYCGHGIFFNLV